VSLAPANGDDILQKVRQAFHNAFGTEPESIEPTSSPDDIDGWDSLGHVNLAAHLETLFDISFTVDELMEMQDVDAILRIVGSRR
jgi:acyl carrier protein